jgi:hypothetical protein
VKAGPPQLIDIGGMAGPGRKAMAMACTSFCQSPKEQQQPNSRYSFSPLDAVADLRPGDLVQFADAVHQLVALAVGGGGEVGAAHGGGGERDARTDVEADGDGRLAAAVFDVDHAQAVARAERHRRAAEVGQLLHERTRQLAHIEPRQHLAAQRQGRRAEAVLAFGLPRQEVRAVLRAAPEKLPGWAIRDKVMNGVHLENARRARAWQRDSCT